MDVIDIRYGRLDTYQQALITMPDETTGETLYFNCAESAYLATKCPERAKEFRYLNWSDADTLARTITPVPDWSEKRLDNMRKILTLEFEQNPELKRELLDTGNAVLVKEYRSFYGSPTGARLEEWLFWGFYRNGGRNNFGKLLMELRDKFRNEETTAA